MTANETLIVIVLAVALVAILIRSRFVSRGRDQGIEFAREVLSAWATQGPFESGKESAAAMRIANIEVLGPETAESFAEAIEKHAVAFDNDPGEWERVRQGYLEIAEQKQERENADQIAANMAMMLNMHFVSHRKENGGELPDSIENDQFIVGYIAGVAGCAARVGTGSEDDVGHIVLEVFNQLFPGKGVALSNKMQDWKKSGEQGFQEAARLGMNEFFEMHKVLVVGDENAWEKSVHELRGLERYVAAL